jgi:nucleoside phosphorylase
MVDQNGDFEVHHAGVGSQAFGKYLASLLPVSSGRGLWVNAGFGGGLRPELEVGRVVMEEVSALTGWQLERFVTVDRVLVTAEQKARVAETNPMALAADMESAVFAEFCRV